MNIISNTLKKYHIRKALNSDIEDIVKLIAEGALTLPALKILSLTYQQALAYARVSIQKPFDSGYAVVSEDDNKQIVGCMLGKDYVIPLGQEKDLIRLSPKFTPFFSMFKQMNKRYFLNREKFSQGQCLNLMRGVVKQKAQKNNLSVQMLKILEDMATKNGFKCMLIQTNHKQIEYICQKQNYKLVQQLKYKDFEYNGKKIFAQLDSKIGLMLKNSKEL